MKKTLLFASLLALAGASSVAAAADGNWFLRGDLGSARIDVNGVGHSDTTTGGAIDGGYYFNPNFGVEAGYVNFGSHNGIKIDGWGAGIVGKADFGPNHTGFFLQGRLGMNRLSASGFGFSSSTTKPYIGVGAGYDFSREFGMSVNYLYNDASDSGFDAHAGLLSVGAEVRF